MNQEKVLVYEVPNFKTNEDRIHHIHALLNSLVEDMKFDKTLMCRYSFKSRDLVETNLNYVQINYQTLLYKEIDGEIYVFTNRKIANSSEQRLMGRLNVFVGGHCNTDDIHNCGETILDYLKNNRDRELAEEIKMSIPIEQAGLQYTSTLYTMDEPVSCYHACLYDVYEIPIECEIEVLEKDKLEGKFYNINDLLADDKLDTWSVLALLELKAKI